MNIIKLNKEGAYGAPEKQIRVNFDQVIMYQRNDNGGTRIRINGFEGSTTVSVTETPDQIDTLLKLDI